MPDSGASVRGAGGGREFTRGLYGGAVQCMVAAMKRRHSLNVILAVTLGLGAGCSTSQMSRIDRNRDICSERDRIAKVVIPVCEHGHFVQVPSVRAHQRNREHVRGVQNHLRRIPVIPMVVQWPVEQHKIRAVALRMRI